MSEELLRGADVVARTLKRAGIDHIFALSGNHIMSLFDATLEAGLELIHVRHEGAAVHMADAWARISGRVGVAWVTGGPGHANAVSALYTALASESPVVLLSGHAPRAREGMGAFQELDQAAMAAPVTKASWVAEDPERLGTDIAQALRIAANGRPGPVHLSLPEDVLDAAAAGGGIADSTQAHPPRQPLSAGLARSVTAGLAAAQRPLVLTGPQTATPAGRRLTGALQDALGVPVIPMESPRGINDPSLGAFAELLPAADHILLLGKKLDFTLGFGEASVLNPHSRLVHIDPDPDACQYTLRAMREAEHPAQIAVADVRCAIEALAGAHDAPGHSHEQWNRTVAEALAYRPPEWSRLRGAQPGTLHPVQLGRAVQAALAQHEEAITVCDGGEFGQWAQACLGTARRIINGPAGAIGGALPFALGACVAQPEAPIVALSGDGALGFHLAEFDTAVRHNLPVVVVVGNDACWNAEYQIQLRRYGAQRTVGCELLRSRYDKAAEAMGAYAAYVEREQDLAEALNRAIASGRPTCVNVAVSRHPAPKVRRNN